MGIREFSSIVEYGSIVNKLKCTEYDYSTPCEFDAIIIDTVSYFYACLVELKIGPGEELEFYVYKDLARQCFDRIVKSMVGDSFFKCKEIFISFDIAAPATKRRTQNERRLRGCYVEMSERIKFYKAIVMEFVGNVNVHCDNNITVSFPTSFEGYESSLPYTVGEGEYIGMNYIHHLYHEKAYRSFVMFGNDNDILMMSCIFNTCLDGISVQYIAPTRGCDGPIRKHLKCLNIVDAFVFMCNTFLVGNDFIPMVISGTNNQVKHMFDDSLYASDHVVKLARRAFDRNNNQYIYESSHDVIDDFTAFIITLLTHATDRYNRRCNIGKTSPQSVETEDFDYYNLDIFIKRFVWNVCYYANTLYAQGGAMIYSEFSNIYPSHAVININSPVFIDDVKDRVLRFLIETSIRNNTLESRVRESLQSVFSSHNNYRLECDYLLRASKCSAGVDFIIYDTIPAISPGCDFILPIKFIPHCLLDNFYVIERSSAFVKGIECVLANDRNSLYPGIKITNKSCADVEIDKGSRIFQIIFTPYCQSDRGLYMDSIVMHGGNDLEYHKDDGYYSFEYTSADVVNDTETPMMHIVDTKCFISLINVKLPHVYVKICSENVSGINIHNGVIDSDYADSIKLLCRIEPGHKLGKNTRLCAFRMFEYIHVSCNLKTEHRTGGIGSSD